MKKLLGLTLLALITIFGSTLDVSAKGKPAGDPPEVCEGTFTDCVDGLVCFHQNDTDLVREINELFNQENATYDFLFVLQ